MLPGADRDPGEAGIPAGIWPFCPGPGPGRDLLFYRDFNRDFQSEKGNFVSKIIKIDRHLKFRLNNTVIITNYFYFYFNFFGHVQSQFSGNKNERKVKTKI